MTLTTLFYVLVIHHRDFSRLGHMCHTASIRLVQYIYLLSLFVNDHLSGVNMNHDLSLASTYCILASFIRSFFYLRREMYEDGTLGFG